MDENMRQLLDALHTGEPVNLQLPTPRAMELTPGDVSRLLQESPRQHQGANHWPYRLGERSWKVDEASIARPECLLVDGQHRLHAVLRRMLKPRNRRRIVRVATLKYRARKRRR